MFQPCISLKRIVFLLIVIISVTSQAQISFENGYFIDNAGNRTACLIRNVDWMKNPSTFRYKLSSDEKEQSGVLNSVQEFGVGTELKYIRATVKLDRASNELKDLTMSRKPNFLEETIYLKVLVEGDANLYVYEESHKRNYFYNTSSSEIQPLIYKRYINANNIIAKNNQYKQQIRNELSHPKISQRQISQLAYNQKSLTRFFILFNSFFDKQTSVFNKTKNKDWLNILVRPGLGYSSVNFNAVEPRPFNIDFEREVSLRLGIEFEMIMPFNKNKWAVIVEPFYETYNSERAINDTQTPKVAYKAFGLGIGVRHYMFLKANSKLFLNASATAAFVDDSGIIGLGRFLNFEKGTALAFGVGYNYRNKFSIELRHHIERELLIRYLFQSAKYGGQSLIIGYKLF